MDTAPATSAEGPFDRLIELKGHLLDSDLMNRVMDRISEAGCSFEIEHFDAGARHEDPSLARIRVEAPTAPALKSLLRMLLQEGAVFVDRDVDARLETVTSDGVAPDDFYSTTIYPTDVRIGGSWVRVAKQRMDAIIVADESAQSARCILFRDLKSGDRVVCGVDGILIHATQARKGAGEFAFMSAGVSSERRVELAVDEIARDMREVRDRRGRIVVVAGPVVVHTGAGPYLAQLVRDGYVQALLGGNAIAAHDIEQALFGTSLGVDLARGIGVHEGHRHHLKAINLVRRCGSIAQAVQAGYIPSGIMYECVKAGIPFSLAGSIRDDGPLPDTLMDLLEAQRQYASLIEGADMILMLSSMLHSIGTGNMTPSGVKLICVDISPAVVTKLADRGSIESKGIVTDVGLFLNLLAGRLANA